MSGKVYFISGGNRGIGYEFVKQLSSNPENTIIASTRDASNSPELQKLADSNANVKIVKLDVSDSESIEGLDQQLKTIAKDGIDILISNAGIAKSFYPAIETERSVYEDHYRTNVLGPIYLTKALYPYLKLKDTKQLVYISSLSGSIGGMIPLSSSAYGQSKAALNYTVKELSLELGPEGFVAISVHPGMVSTDMGKENTAKFLELNPQILEAFKGAKVYSPEESVETQLEKIIFKLSKDDNGKFFDVEGGELPF